jgi:hypothetical protein
MTVRWIFSNGNTQMKAKIEVESLADGVFQVRVSEGATESSHRVTLKPQYFNRLTAGKIEAPELIRRSFEFLLDREPKESILSRFDLQDIQRYFPDFERTIERQVSSAQR